MKIPVQEVTPVEEKERPHTVWLGGITVNAKNRLEAFSKVKKMIQEDPDWIICDRVDVGDYSPK